MLAAAEKKCVHRVVGVLFNCIDMLDPMPITTLKWRGPKPICTDEFFTLLERCGAPIFECRFTVLRAIFGGEVRLEIANVLKNYMAFSARLSAMSVS